MALVSWTSGYEGLPLGTAAMSTVDDQIRELKEQIGRRLEQGGHALTQDPRSIHALSAVDANDGRHIVDSGGSGISPHWYKSDGTTQLVTVSDTGAAMVAGSTWSGGNVTTLNNPGHGHDVTWNVYLPSTATGRVTGVMFHNLGNGTVTLISCKIQCWTAPGAGGLTVDIHKLDNTHTDPASTGADDDGTVFTVKPTIGSGNFLSAAATIDAAKDECAVGEAWVFEIDTNDAADDIHVAMQVRRV